MGIEQVKTDKFCFYLFDDLFDKEELEQIWFEVKTLHITNKLMKPQHTGSAENSDQQILKSNRGVWLEQEFENRNHCTYFHLYKRPFQKYEKELKNYSEVDYTLNLLYNTSSDNTLLSHYHHNDYYSPHQDRSCYTYLFWIHDDPKTFEGGQLRFDDINYEIDFKNNMGILFPSWVTHSVLPIKILPEHSKYFVLGRVSFSTFFGY